MARLTPEKAAIAGAHKHYMDLLKRLDALQLKIHEAKRYLDYLRGEDSGETVTQAVRDAAAPREVADTRD